MPSTLPPLRSKAWLLRCITLWLAATICCPSALAGPSRIVEQAFVADPGGQMAPEQAMQQPQTVYTGALSRPLNSAVVWVRLRVAPEAELQPVTVATIGMPATEQLRVIPMFNGSLSLYDPLQRDVSGRMRRLDTSPTSAPFRVRTLSIPVGNQARDLWLRLQPNGPGYLAAEVLTTEAASVRTVLEALLQGVVLGFYVMMILLGVTAWMLDRQGIGQSLLVKQVCNLLLAILNADLMMLPDLHILLNWPEASGTNTVECLRLLNMVVSLWFFVKVLELLHAPRWVLQLQRSPLVVMICCLGLLVTGQLALVHIIELLLFLVMPLSLLLSGLACEREPLQARTAMALARRGAERAGLGLVLGTAWVASIPTASFKTQGFSGISLLIPVITSSAVGVLLMLGWRKIQADRAAQAEQQHRAELTALALEFERGERQRQQEFMGMLTHELKAPLSTLGMVIGSPRASASMQRHAELALASMRQVIDHCAQSADIDDASAPPQRVECSLAVELRLRCDALAERSRIHITPADEDAVAVPTVLADPRLLSIVFNNLLDNALKYSSPGSPIHVSLVRERTPEGSVQKVSVINQAPALSLPDALKLFQKYYRGDAVRRVSGSGLGLHLSRLLARRMGGDLQYQADGCRVMFTLVLPESLRVAAAAL